MDNNLDSVLDMYLFEANALLEQLDDILLRAESEQAFDKECIDEIFRIKSAEKKGMELGMQQVIGKGKTDVLIRQYMKKFSTLPEEFQMKIQSASAYAKMSR